MSFIPFTLYDKWGTHYRNHKINKNIQGIKIPNKNELKLLQFADDTNLITINEESKIEKLILFKKYNKASGATINISKIAIIPLANAQIYNFQNKIQNFRITKNQEIFKILGIYFSKNLHYANKYNWQECLQKVEKQINLLIKRKLSLREKAYYIISYYIISYHIISFNVIELKYII